MKGYYGTAYGREIKPEILSEEARALELLDLLDTHMNCAYCEAGIVELHNQE